MTYDNGKSQMFSEYINNVENGYDDDDDDDDDNNNNNNHNYNS